jgi:hypothetical protein
MLVTEDVHWRPASGAVHSPRFSTPTMVVVKDTVSPERVAE